MLRRDAEAAQAQRQWKKILVPAVDRPYSGRCLEVAYRLAQESGATVQLAYVLEVPPRAGAGGSPARVRDLSG